MKTSFKYFIITVLLFFTQSYSKDKIENDRKRRNVFDKVRFFSEIKYKAVDRWGNIEKEEQVESEIQITFNEKGYVINLKYYSERDGKLYWNEIYKYDLKNNIIQSIAYKLDGSIINKNIYKYDLKGNKVEYRYYSNEGELKNKTLYIYNINGNEIESCKYYSDNSIEYKWISKYDLNGNILEKNQFLSNGTLSCTFKYDEHGNKTEEINTSSGSSRVMLSRNYFYKYDEKGNEIEYKTYTLDGKLYSISCYKYDNKNNKIEVNYYKSDSILSSSRSYQYKFDTHGNWIKKFEYENGIIKFVTERRYKYYP